MANGHAPGGHVFFHESELFEQSSYRATQRTCIPNTKALALAFFFTREVSRFSRIWTSATPQAAMFFDSYLNNISFALPVYVSEKVWLNLTQRLQTRCHLKILTNA